jgi:ribosomal protein L18E
MQFWLDAASLAGATVSIRGSVKAVLAIRASTSKSWKEILKGLDRAERKRLTKELIRMQKPGISNSKMKELVRSGEFPARFSASEIKKSIFDQLREALDAALSLTSSATSGNVKLLYVSVYQE